MIEIERMEAIEANSAWRGVPRRVLMENAGAGIADRISSRRPSTEKVTVYSGTGNNGGDGFVAARHMINKDIDVEIILLGRESEISTSAAWQNWQSLASVTEGAEIKVIRDSTELRDLPDLGSDVLLDAMLGTGISGGLREPVATAVEKFNETDAFKVAVDVPTGVDPSIGEVQEQAAECDLTVTFHDNKPGLKEAGDKYVGEVEIVDIGVPEGAKSRAGPGDVRMSIPDRAGDSYKGQHGELLVIGGGTQYAGAPALAALSALKTGTDLVRIAVPKSASKVVNSFSPDLITTKLSAENLSPEVLPEIEEDLIRADAVVIGPGIGTSKPAQEGVTGLLEKLVEEYQDVPTLLDADGLKIASDNPDLLQSGNFVATPHAGEFKVLSGSEIRESRGDRIKRVSNVSEDLDTPILLKSHTDVCAAPDGRTALNDTGNPGMTVGGTGDVLSGIAGGLLSQGAEPFRGLVAGAFVSGLAGDLCAEDLGYEFTATDVKDRIPTALSKAREYW